MASVPTAAVGVALVHPEAITGTGTVILRITQGNSGGADLANLEMNSVSALTGTVMVKAQNEHIDGQVGEIEPLNCSVDRD